MNLALGIDTGGTYTDAVLVDHDSGAVLAGAKALTTRHDLAVGVRSAIATVLAAGARYPGPAADVSQIRMVALSTTLATNTLAEDQTGAVCLLLIGYDPVLLRQCGFNQRLATRNIVHVRGGHDEKGNEAQPLDEPALRAAILAQQHAVEAFAISGYFAVRNPTHELRARALVEELTGLPATCGHELTSRLDSIRRATTVALNAHLIAPLRELIGAVRGSLAELGITAPLMVVKGDGSLVRAEWAALRPIETILSGPAASVVGAWHLAGRRDAWVVDVGGTTTDIAALRDGWPTLSQEGARVGNWRTMVEAIAVHTTGLGGDSHVRVDPDRRLVVGPGRAVPLALLAAQYPDVLARLAAQQDAAPSGRERAYGVFLLPGRPPARRLSDSDRGCLELLSGGPVALADLLAGSRMGEWLRHRLDELETQGFVRRAAFTPTDALHVLARYTPWSVEAARLGAALLGRQAGLAADALCEQIVRSVSDRIAGALLTKVLEDETGQPGGWADEPVAAYLVQKALAGETPGDLSCRLDLRRAVVAIGAPVAAYLPLAASKLHTELIIPEHAEVANAVGAVAGGVLQRLRILISPLDGAGHVRVHLPTGVRDFESLEPAVAFAQETLLPYVTGLARQAGAGQIETQVERQDQLAVMAAGHGDDLYLGTDLTITAMGRPTFSRSPVA